MVNVRHLAVFRAVAKTGSVSAAARVLHISQPAVTKTLHLLEDGLQMPLFQRIKGRLLITPEAQALLPQVERLFGQVDAVQHLTQEIRSGHAGNLTVASVATLSSTIVGMAISRFNESHPNVLFDLRALSTRQVIESVMNNQVDVGVIDVPEVSVDVEMNELCRAELACVMRHDHPLAALTQISAADLSGENIITFAEDTRTGWSVRDALRKKRSSARILFTVNQTFSAYALAQAGSGVALVDPFPMLSGVFPELAMRPFRPIIQTRPCSLLGKLRPVSTIAREFVAELRTVANDFVARSTVLMQPTI
jgi:DNA-binding transcriptional LysR family regulator